MAPLTSLVNLLVIGALIVIMIWLFRSATHARNLGIPARHEPYWAIIGFIVPVVNFWFPYQVAADCLPVSDVSGRRTILRWLLLYIVGALVFEVLGVVSSFVQLSAIILIVGGFAWVALEIRFGLAMLSTVAASHEQATSAYQ